MGGKVQLAKIFEICQAGPQKQIQLSIPDLNSNFLVLNLVSYLGCEL